MKSVSIDRHYNFIYTRKYVISFIMLALFSMIISGCGAADSNSTNANRNFVELSVNTDSNQTSNNGENNSNSANQSETAAAKGTPSLKGANLFDLLRKKMKETPSITAKELAAHGNDLIKQHGFNFALDLQGKSVAEKENNKAASSDKEPKVQINYDFTLADNSKKTFHIMNQVQDHPCGTVIDLPVTKVTEKKLTFAAQLNGKPVEQTVERTKDIVIEEVHLIDPKNKSVIRKWFTPIDSTPSGISADGTIIYLDTWEFRQDTTDNYKEISMGLVLEIDKDGNIKFVDAKEIPSSEGEKVEMNTDASKQTSYGEFTKFKVGGNEYILFYEVPCT